MDTVGIKRRLRELKQLEQKIRFGNLHSKPSALIWDLFFDLKPIPAGKAKYPLIILASMSHDDFKRVISEYWSFVYRELFHESDLPEGLNHDPGVLLQWGLPPDADAGTIKKKFRELAKLYHPDTGGDEQSFITLMEAYQKLTGK